MHLTPPQIDGLLLDVVTTHLNKLERLSAAAKSFPSFDPAQAEREDRRAAWAYRLLHAQGSNAVVRPADETQMFAEGLTAADIAAVQDHLAMLRINDLVPTRHGILQNLLAANGAPANASNLALAKDVHFAGCGWRLRNLNGATVARSSRPRNLSTGSSRTGRSQHIR